MTVRQLISELVNIKDQEATVWYLYENGRRVMCPFDAISEGDGYVKLYLRE